MPAIRRLVLAALCLAAPLAHALTAQVSETFPLADTIYGVSEGEGKLRSDGRHAFFFWVDEDRLYVTRIDGEERVAKLVFPFPVLNDYEFDAVWTGSHFLVVAQNLGYTLIGRRLDSSGDAVGESFQVASSALWPRLAFNGRNVLLLYTDNGVVTQLLTPSGAPEGDVELLDPALVASSEFHLASNGDGFAAIVPAGAFTPESLYVLDAKGEVVARQTLDTSRAQWSLASNGSRYVAVSTTFGQSAAHLFEGNGTPAARVDLQPTAGSQRFYRFPAATWTGTRWLLALYIENGSLTRFIEVDAEGRTSVLAELPGASRMQLTNAGGRVVGTWNQHGVGVVAGDVPPAGNARPVLFAARHQQFLATATSSSGTLFVWREVEPDGGALRAGVRTHDGRWSEREIASGFAYALAASDGTGFVVVTRFGVNGDRIIRLDANGEPIPGGTMPFDAFAPLAIASNGNGYALVGVRLNQFIAASNLLTAHITSAGVTPAGEIPFHGRGVVDIDIASDGEGYLVAWGVEQPCSPSLVFCGAERIAGMLLSGSAVPQEPLLLLTEREPTSELALEWNGRDYVLVRNAAATIVASHITRQGTPRDRHVLANQRGSNLSAVPANGGVTAAWVSDAGVFAAALTDGGPDGSPLLIDNDRRYFPWYIGTLAGIGNGRLAFVFTARPEEAPIHGRLHVMAKIIAPLLPPLPSAPLLTVQRNGANAILQWTASGPVLGYRVEQRIGDGPWIEVGGWLDPPERTLTVTAGTSTQFRVRAFNEAGAGPYSATATRRRAVR